MLTKHFELFCKLYVCVYNKNACIELPPMGRYYKHIPSHHVSNLDHSSEEDICRLQYFGERKEFCASHHNFHMPFTIFPSRITFFHRPTIGHEIRRTAARKEGRSGNWSQTLNIKTGIDKIEIGESNLKLYFSQNICSLQLNDIHCFANYHIFTLSLFSVRAYNTNLPWIKHYIDKTNRNWKERK